MRRFCSRRKWRWRLRRWRASMTCRSALFAKKKYDELESCGSAADFLLGMEMEEDLLGREEVEGGSHDVFFKINDSNKCHCLSPPIESPPAVNHDQAEAIVMDDHPADIGNSSFNFSRGIVF